MSRPPVTIPAEEYDRLRRVDNDARRIAATLLARPDGFGFYHGGPYISEDAPPGVFAAVRELAGDTAPVVGQVSGE